LVTGTRKANRMNVFGTARIPVEVGVISCRMNKKQLRRLALVSALVVTLTGLSVSQTAAPPPDAKAAPAAPAAVPAAVPAIDGGIGTCSADFIVNDADGKPVYAATIKVHIEYGFMYLRKLDLQVGTNADGKARFTGFPDRVKHGLFFEASEGDRVAEAFDDPAANCKNQFTVVLRKKP
jgi:hypothetical protein